MLGYYSAVVYQANLVLLSQIEGVLSIYKELFHSSVFGEKDTLKLV